MNLAPPSTGTLLLYLELYLDHFVPVNAMVSAARVRLREESPGRKKNRDVGIVPNHVVTGYGGPQQLLLLYTCYILEHLLL